MWKQLKHFPDYMVSCTGRVLSLKNEEPKVLKHGVDGKGYLFVNLSIKGKMKAFRVHRLVASAFLGLKINNPKICVLHKDDDPKNNNVVNLMTGTQLDNMRDMIKKGRQTRHGAKINKEQLYEIRAKLKNKEKGTKLAREYNLSPSSISAIKNKTRWKNI